MKERIIRRCEQKSRLSLMEISDVRIKRNCKMHKAAVEKFIPSFVFLVIEFYKISISALPPTHTHGLVCACFISSWLIRNIFSLFPSNASTLGRVAFRLQKIWICQDTSKQIYISFFQFQKQNKKRRKILHFCLRIIIKWQSWVSPAKILWFRIRYFTNSDAT